MAMYNQDLSVLTISNYNITGFENAQDAIVIAPVGDDGDITYGVNDDGVFVHSSNKGGIITIKLLQHCESNAFLNDLRNTQINYPKSFSPIPVYFKDTLNGDEIFLAECFFTTPPTHTRGTGHNTTTWTLKATKMETKLKKGVYN